MMQNTSRKTSTNSYNGEKTGSCSSIQQNVVLTVTNKRNPIVTEYTIRGQLLAAVTSARYLGVTITDKVNWSQHIDSITKKANRTLGILRRNLKISSISIKEQAYKTLVRPLVEYASPIWEGTERFVHSTISSIVVSAIVVSAIVPVRPHF